MVESVPQSQNTDGIETLVPLIIKLQNAFNAIKAKNSIELP
jgi:vacuolar protein sorting-associated protein 1